MSGVRFELACCESMILQEIADKRFKRNDVALTYAMSLSSSERDRIDWRRVNEAIIERWSTSALLYIKDRAWKLIQKRAEPEPQP